MQLFKRFTIGIKLSLIALFLTGITLFSFFRFDHQAVVAASHPVTKANVSSSTCGSWSVVASPNIGTKPSYLSSVAAISGSDVWTVGTYDLQKTSGAFGTLIEHWNGKRWSITPRPVITHSSLQGVAALASNNVWAVGGYFNATTRLYQTLIEHWDGSLWSVVSSPNPSNLSGQVSLASIAAISANDIWAVGYSQISNGDFQTLVEHWDGTQWSIIASPDVGGSGANYLFGVAAVASNNVWAVGQYYTSPGGGVRQTLVEHWDRTQWSIIASPNVGTLGSGLQGVSVVSASNMWAVGFYSTQQASQTLVEHWDGTQWSVVSSPNVGSGSNALLAITANSPKNIWAVGDSTSSTNPNDTQSLIEHWDSVQWSVVSSPGPGTFKNVLNGITHVPGTRQVWTVGYFDNGNGAQTLTEFYC